VEPVGVWVGGMVGRRGAISGGGAVGRRVISGGRLTYVCWRGRPTCLRGAVGAIAVTGGRRVILGGWLAYVCWQGRPTRLLRAVGARVGAGPRP
jgi:hypothetical protein